MRTKINWESFVNKKFGSLTVIEDAGLKNRTRMLMAVCDCGNVGTYNIYDIYHNRTTSCGCFRRNMVSEKNLVHGLSKTPLYRVWNGMVDRCYNENHIGFKNYGGRGIKLCDEWRSDFSSFYNWAIQNGYNKGLQIDRINNDLGYSPTNCRFITQLENSNNRRITKFLTFNGQTRCVSQWSEITGISPKKIRCRIGRLNWSAEKALTTP